MKHSPLATLAVGLTAAACVAVPAVGAHAAPPDTVPVTRPATRFDLTAATARADAAIQQRLASLASLQGALQPVTHSECQRASIASQLSADTAGLTGLQAQIDALPAGTTATEFKALSSQITQHYRIYMLETPKAHVVVACDRILTVADRLDQLGVSTGDAQSARDQAIAAVDGTIGLTADNGNIATRTANRSALLEARSELKGAISSLRAGRDAAKK
jgi:hypothetical protein